MRRATLTALLGAFLLPGARAADDPAKAPLTADRLWQIKRLAVPAISPDGQWAVVPVTTWDVKEDKALTDLWLVKTDGSDVARPDLARGERDEPGLEPRREVDRLRSQARGRRERPGLPAAHERRQSPPADERPDRSLGPEVVRGQPEARLHQPGLAEPRQLGRAGEAAEGAQGLEDDGAHLRQARGPVLGPLARRSPGPRLLDRPRGRGAKGGHARHGARAVAGGGGHLLLRHRARRLRDRLRRRLDQTGIDANFDVYVVSAEGGAARNLTSDNPAGDGSPSTARTGGSLPLVGRW